jgi:hypothetical protein
MTCASRDPDSTRNGSPLPTRQAFPSTVNKSRKAFHRELERLQDEVLVLGSMVEKATLRAVDALRAQAR